jgi:hypothetical protein
MKMFQLGSLCADEFELQVPGCDLTQVHFADWAAWVRALVDGQVRVIVLAAKQSAKRRQLPNGVARPQ